MKSRKLDTVDALAKNSHNFEKEMSKVEGKTPAKISENNTSEESSDYEYAENDEDDNLSAACIASLCVG